MTSAASSRHHHHPVRRAAAGLGGLGTMLLLNTARAFLVRLPLSFGPPIAHPYQPAVRWLGSVAAPPALGAATGAASSSSSSSSAAEGSSTSSSTSEVPTTPTPVKLPAAVSPSSLGDFKTCPRLYRFRHVERVPEPASEVMVRGSMVHDALDQVGGSVGSGVVGGGVGWSDALSRPRD